MSDIRIRAYCEQDLDGVAKLWSLVFPNDPPRNQAHNAIPIKEDFQPGLIFVADKIGQIVGTVMAGYDGHRGWIYSVAVHPEFRRKNVGTKLMARAVAALQDLGCIKVNLQVRAKNDEVVRFYEALGFEVEARVSMGMRINDPPH